MNSIEYNNNRMTFIYAIFASILLILSGFLLTPSMFNFTNYEYRNFVPDLQRQQVLLGNRIGALKTEARAVIAEGAKTGLDLRLRSDAEYEARSQGKYPVESFASEASIRNDKPPTPEEINRLKSQAEIRNQFNDLDREIENQYAAIEDINKRIANHSTESNNAYLIARALALGALGALVTRLAKNSEVRATPVNELGYSSRDLTVSMLVGAIVSVVTLGLFYTKQITIFKTQEISSTLPDYWRTTILCLGAGAFSDRLLKAASDRVGRYVDDGTEKRKEKMSDPSL